MSNIATLSAEEFREHYERKESDFRALEKIVLDLIFNGIASIDVKTLPIQHRIKKIDSAVQKFKRKSYTQPFQEMTDCVGVRIITFLDSDLSLVEDKLRELFSVDETNIINKRETQEVNQVGYRSSHIIASLGAQREALPEYQGLCSIPFEIQIRTILEHAWSEIEHGQQYKAVKALPKPLQRRLNIVSGTLELLDRELSQIAAETRQYMQDVANKESEISEDPISASSIIAVCTTYGNEHGIRVQEVFDDDYDILIEELTNLGIKSVEELRSIIESVPLQKYPRNEFNDDIPIFGLVRTAMAIRDPLGMSRVLSEKDIKIPRDVYDFLISEKVAGVEAFRGMVAQRE